ncbi:hypothetical protein CB0940_02264 [Cercospora beticola]|uniref:S-adenosyl-L-methionine-dependent methyltransferase n=1 Tax=Cercospora beticola TaxID=122368 RepID=A0A2G5I589_CERBT|nr:hypothetical protein CB0940_02264 [Cercospora beticola]PIA99950.1 hypothetical protein CB0940_02264 [Cercospora beticola]WPA99384.1 hypothetical protein RHO25_004001 [Cercospora beticola]
MSTMDESFVDVERPADTHEPQKDTSSISSYEWTYLNGRRYASSSLGHYYMPNDEPEIQRLNEQHCISTQVKGDKLHFAPLPSPNHRPLRILDIGCGSGIWCLEMADKYPHAKITGMDVSPIQPSKNKPDNVGWIVQDMEGDWPFPSQQEDGSEGYFDLIHLSLVHGCVADWDKFMQKVVKHLVPGGWVEHQEFSLCRQYMLDAQGQKIDMGEDVDKFLPFFRWNRLMEQAAAKRGRQLQLGPHLKDFQERAGLLRVEERVFAHKWGTWMDDPQERELGERTMLSTMTGMEGFTTAMFTKSLGWSLEDTKAFIVDIKQNMRDDSIRKVIDLHVVCGQKPSLPEKSSIVEDRSGKTSPLLSIGTGVLVVAGAASLFSLWLARRR